MSTRVQVRISTASVREGKNEKFWSLNVSDEMTPDFERLPEAELKSYSLSVSDWEALKKVAESKGAKWTSKKDKNGNTYLATSPKVVVLDIEITKSLKDSLRELDRRTTALTISGQVKKISVREQRAGNGLALED